ncbi:uncharacterized protein ACNS7B_021255 [Menidia menidia]
MKRFALLLLCLIPVALTQVVDPRGARPVEHGTRSEKCAAQREWPFCLDVDWGSKCPSGCRVQGLMDRSDNDLLRKIERIRNLLDENRARYRSTDQVSKQTYSYLKEKLTIDSGNDNSYYDLAQNLRQRISDLKMKIDRQLKILGALKDRVRDQVTDMQRLEVDIDIKLRSCKGSCSGYVEHRVDLESYVSLDKQVQQLSTQAAQSIEAVGSLYVMKSRPLKDVLVSSIYKSKDVAGQQKEDMFPEVKTVQLVLEEEGSSSSPATISKVPGTSFSSSSSSSSTSSTASSSSSSSSSSSTASKSITELGGRGDGDFFGGLGSSFDSQPSTGHVSTQTISCTKSIRRTVVHTKDGPVERVEEVTDGGPDCQVTDLTKGGMGSLFPSLSHTSSSSSSSLSSSSKTVHSDGTKGSLLGDFKSGFNPFGGDLGAFMTDNADDDVPDFHARSVKTARVERQDDFVGKVCARLRQQKQDGRHPPSPVYGRRRCSRRSRPPLCSDEDWVSRCPSGCRLQALMSRLESDLDRKLRRVCKKAKMLGDASEKQMSAVTRVYNSNRKSIVGRFVSELKFVDRAEGLAGNLTALRGRSAVLSEKLKQLNLRVKLQVDELYRIEVDVDMKLRTCRGSCRSVLPFGPDHQGYRSLSSSLEVQQKAGTPLPPGEITRIRLKPVEGIQAPSAEYKAIPVVRRELLTQFEDIGQIQLVIEESPDGNLLRDV